MRQLTNDRLLSSRMRVTTGSENLKKPNLTYFDDFWNKFENVNQSKEFVKIDFFSRIY